MGSAFSGPSREERAFERGYEHAVRDASANYGMPPAYDPSLKEKAMEEEKEEKRRVKRKRCLFAAIQTGAAGGSAGS